MKTPRICYKPSCKKPVDTIAEPYSLYCCQRCRKEHRQLVGRGIFTTIENLTHNLAIPQSFKRSR